MGRVYGFGQSSSPGSCRRLQLAAGFFALSVLSCDFLFAASSSSSVSQYGITWSFDRAYTVGQFANGDFWVVGPVRITGISPAAANGKNGWEVNPVSTGGQAFDSTGPDYEASLMPALPYLAQPGKSIVKAISTGSACTGNAGGKSCLQTAAVLTVLSAIPPDDGATVFRPPYGG